MEAKQCPSCNKVLGTTSSCKECLKHLQDIHAGSLSEEEGREHSEKADAFLKNPPWYAKYAPAMLLLRTKLLAAMTKSYFKGEYKELPWLSIASIVAAIAYVVSPIDLIPDVLIPIGWTDDAIVVALVFEALGVDLKKFAESRNLDPKNYGL